MDGQLDKAALDYHRFPAPGKGKVTAPPVKPAPNRRDLSLACSPGVVVPCLEVQKNSFIAYDHTSKGNLVAVVGNGAAVLGTGDIGALAAEPAMEGKGCLFRKCAGIDVFDLDVDETGPEKPVEIMMVPEPATTVRRNVNMTAIAAVDAEAAR
jgi:malate dehydrogenase (oxaloacetate-decarboxylating)(NADP+)